MIRMRVVRVVALAGLAGAVVLSVLAPASAGAAPKRPASASQVVLRSSFQPVTPTGPIVTSGDYLLLGRTVINNRLGTTIALDPQCQVVGLGPPWVLMSCPPSSNPSGPSDLELYSLADGTRQTVTPSPGLPQCPSGPFNGEKCSAPVGVGAYWIRWDASCYHCATTSFFQNIQTGELRDDPTNATTYADLNSPALAHSTCPGVRLIRNPYSYGARWGSLTPVGQFALATNPPEIGPSVFLERCGTRMRRPLVNVTSLSSAVAANSGAVVWQADISHLSGLFLPSLQTFTIPLPSAIVSPPGAPGDLPVGGFVLTSKGLYVGTMERSLWRTASPTALPVNTSRPTLTRSGNTVTCGRGSWRNAVGFSYAWRVNGTATKDAKPTLAVDKPRQRRSVSCSVTASNAGGTTTAASAQLHVR